MTLITTQFNLSNKLRLVYLGAVLLVLLISLISWLSFQQIAASQNNIVDRVIPTMQGLQHVSRCNIRLHSLAAQLHLATNLSSLNTIEDQLNSEFTKLNQATLGLQTQAFSPTKVDQVNLSAKALQNSLQEQIYTMRSILKLNQSHIQLTTTTTLNQAIAPERGDLQLVTVKLNQFKGIISAEKRRSKLISEQLSQQINQLIDLGYQQINAASLAAKKAVNYGYSGLFVAANLLLLGLASSIWIFMRFHILGRVKAMERSLHGLRDGDEDISISNKNDEFTRLEQAMQELRNSQRKQKRLQEESTQHALARQKAEHLNLTQTQFLATMSHELRTPLSGIEGTTQLLLETPLSDQQKQYAKLIRLANATLLDILEDMLGYSQLSAGKLKLNNAPFALRQTVDNMLTLQAFKAQEKGIALIREIEPQVPEWWLGDHRKINQILLNLIGNAIKFTNEGCITITINWPKENTLECSVSDTGIGFSSDQQKKVFEAFYQVDDANHRQQGGTGLGLSICQKLVHAMGGQISLNSKPQQGTQVRFTLPLAQVSAPVPQLQTEDHSHQASAALNILVVEDDPINQLVCSKYLEAVGHNVSCANGVDQAMENIHKHAFDAILMDINLNGQSGLELAQSIHKLPHLNDQTLPIILMSAHVIDADLEAYKTAGMADFLYKPFTREQLIKALTKATETAPHNHTLLNINYLEDELDSLGEANIKDIMELFEDDFSLQIQQLKNHISNLQWPKIAQQAHRIKGAAGNLGFNAVMLQAKKIEIACQHETTP